MTALLTSFVVVTLAEMGDKTQLIAFSLASRYRRPWPVLAGILFATTLNHALASSIGAVASRHVPESVLGWILGASFIAFGVWTLFPDDAGPPREARWGPLLTTTVVFFFAEMGDKTQLATAALGARFGAPVAVTAGTTLGMLAADSLAVFAGSRFATVVPLRLVRAVTAALFFAFGLYALVRAATLTAGS